MSEQIDDFKAIINPTSRHDRLLNLRYDLPFVPINTVPDHTKTFILGSNQAENIPVPADASIFMLTASNSGALLMSLNGKPNTPVQLVTADSVTAGQNINIDNVEGAVVNPVNILFDATGISSISLLSYAASQIVSLWVWKNVE